MATPYQILEVPAGSTADEIRAAYRRLAMVHHPDAGGDEDQFKRIAAAYEFLSGKGIWRLGWKDPQPEPDDDMARYGIPPGMRDQWTRFKEAMRAEPRKPKAPQKPRKPKVKAPKPAANHHPTFAEKDRPVAWNLSKKGNLWFLTRLGPVTVFKDRYGRWHWVQAFAWKDGTTKTEFHGPFWTQQAAQMDAEMNWISP